MLLEKHLSKDKSWSGHNHKELNIRDLINSKTESRPSSSLRFLNVSEMCPEACVSSLGGFREYVYLRAALHQGMDTLVAKEKCLFREYAHLKNVGIFSNKAVGIPNNWDQLVFSSPPTRVEGS